MDTFEPSFNALISRTDDRNILFTRNEALQTWRTAKMEDLLFWDRCIPLDEPAREFLETLNPMERAFCIRLALLVWSQTNYTIIIRKVQLQASLALLYRKDSLFMSGTGSGKTMFMVFAAIYPDPSEQLIIITISPLKRLQASQVEDFNERYGIPTLAINEDTSREMDFFRENIYDTRNGKLGRIRHFIVTPEQLFTDPSNGHMPLFGQTLYRYAPFRSKISHIFVDECHTVHVAGLEHNGQPAFRPSWGRLDEVKARLPDSICWHGMTATLPPHMLKTLSAKVLKKGYMLTSSTSNRKNIIYATHPVVNSLEEMRNYQCFLREPYDHVTQPLVLLFFDNKSLAIKVANYLHSLLPSSTKEERDAYSDVVKVYYSDLSSTCLEKVHKSFTPEGRCRILCATSGLSQGVNFPKVDIVCSVGVPLTVVEVVQRGGRAGRQTEHRSLFVIFYEPWVLDILLDEFKYGDPGDPDRTCGPITSKSTKRDRVTYASVELCQCRSCLRRFFAEHVGDDAIDASDFVTVYCCPYHPTEKDKEPFNLNVLLPSFLFTIEKLNEDAEKKQEVEESMRARIRYRPVSERKGLDKLLIEWVTTTAASGKINHGFYDPDDILPFTTRQAIITLFPTTYQQHHSRKVNKRLKDVINESKEWHCLWSEQILEILCEYDGVASEESEDAGEYVTDDEICEGDVSMGFENSDGDVMMGGESEGEESDWYMSDKND